MFCNRYDFNEQNYHVESCVIHVLLFAFSWSVAWARPKMKGEKKLYFEKSENCNTIFDVTI